MWHVQASVCFLDIASDIGIHPPPGHIEDDHRSGDLDLCTYSIEDIEYMMNLNILYSLDLVCRRIPSKYCQAFRHTAPQ